MIAKAGLGVGVGWGAWAGPQFASREPRVAEFYKLVVLLSWVVAPVGLKNLSDLFGTIKLCKRFFWQVVILAWSKKVEKKL